MNKKSKILSYFIVLLVITISLTPASARIDLTGTWHPTGGGGGNPFNQNLNTTDDVVFTRVTGNGSGLWWLNWNNLFNVPAGFADGIDNEGGTPGGNSGQIQYNDGGSFAGAYYYANGNMTSSLDGTWGYYEDDTLIVIGNLSWVGVYKD